MTGLLGIHKPVIAMLHVPPSPGVDSFPGIVTALETMRRDQQVYLECGVDALLLENMHDFPCIREEEMGPEVTAYLTRMAVSARELADEIRGGPAGQFPIGIQVLFAASRTALAIAQAAGLQFIRAEAWTHAHVSDKGIIDAQGGVVKRYQSLIGAEEIRIFTDIQKKHASHALTADLTLGDLAHLLPLHRSDGAIVTGKVTGSAPDPEDLRVVKEHCSLPLLIGSGLGSDNIDEYFDLADGFIVGSSLKRSGDWNEPVDPEQVKSFMTRVGRLRSAAGLQGGI
jgi:uncharacterized protein